MKSYCQNPLCYQYDTKDRIRGVKGSKVYQNRLVSSTYYHGCCTLRCLDDYLNIYMDRFINYIGRLTETPTRPIDTNYDWATIRDNLKRLKDNQ